jgi:hypothetical protein
VTVDLLAAVVLHFDQHQQLERVAAIAWNILWKAHNRSISRRVSVSEVLKTNVSRYMLGQWKTSWRT